MWFSIDQAVWSIMVLLALFQFGTHWTAKVCFAQFKYELKWIDTLWFAFTSLAPEPVSIELNWPDRFVASVSHGLGYSYDNLNQREKIEKINDLITVRTKQENETVEIRWKPENILQPNCEQETIGNCAASPEGGFIRVTCTTDSAKMDGCQDSDCTDCTELKHLKLCECDAKTATYTTCSKSEPNYSKLLGNYFSYVQIYPVNKYCHSSHIHCSN